jgi:hypothetical protein
MTLWSSFFDLLYIKIAPRTRKCPYFSALDESLAERRLLIGRKDVTSLEMASGAAYVFLINFCFLVRFFWFFVVDFGVLK